MEGVILKKWKEVLWADSDKGSYIAFCPTHRQRLEIWTTAWGAIAQDYATLGIQKHLLCPEDNEQFPLFGKNFSDMARRYGNYQESIDLKGARVYDLDNIFTRDPKSFS